MASTSTDAGFRVYVRVTPDAREVRVPRLDNRCVFTAAAAAKNLSTEAPYGAVPFYTAVYGKHAYPVIMYRNGEHVTGAARELALTTPVQAQDGDRVMNWFRCRSVSRATYDAYLRTLRTCRVCGTVHESMTAAVNCEMADVAALNTARLDLWLDTNIPGHAHRMCARCGAPLTAAEREDHEDAWAGCLPAGVPPALCSRCVDGVTRATAQRAVTEQVTAEMRAAVESVVRAVEEQEF